MDRATFEDLCASVGAQVTIDQAPACAEARQPHPRVTVETAAGRRRTWIRPTFRQAFAEAQDWLAEVDV